MELKRRESEDVCKIAHDITDDKYEMWFNGEYIGKYDEIEDAVLKFEELSEGRI